MYLKPYFPFSWLVQHLPILFEHWTQTINITILNFKLVDGYRLLDYKIRLDPEKGLDFSGWVIHHLILSNKNVI